MFRKKDYMFVMEDVSQTTSVFTAVIVAMQALLRFSFDLF